MNKKRIAFHTLGCKLNFSETSSISRQFGIEDFTLVEFSEEADYYIVHTCAVTAVAEKKCRAIVRQAHRRNPKAQIAVMGCAAQGNPQVFSTMEGVSWVLGNNEKFKLGEIINASSNTHLYGHNATLVSDIAKTNNFYPSYSIGDRTRSFFKVQDGCNYYCTYCYIPYMRGHSRSETIENTMMVAREIANSQIKEIILTGVNIGDFGKPHNQSFLELLLQLNELEGIDRIRISSIEPELLNNDIIQLVAHSQKLMPHFHIPLQSGCDKILKLMKRKYLREVFADRVNKIKSIMPDACIAADVIVGFPEENDSDFEDTYNFINNLDISYLHVFPYSERPGTKAIELNNKVPESVKHLRSERLHDLSEKKKWKFYQSQLGKPESVLWESDNINGSMHGFTSNYIKMTTPFMKEYVNTIQNVIIGPMNNEGVCEAT